MSSATSDSDLLPALAGIDLAAIRARAPNWEEEWERLATLVLEPALRKGFAQRAGATADLEGLTARALDYYRAKAERGALLAAWDPQRGTIIAYLCGPRPIARLLSEFQRQERRRRRLAASIERQPLVELLSAIGTILARRPLTFAHHAPLTQPQRWLALQHETDIAWDTAPARRIDATMASFVRAAEGGDWHALAGQEIERARWLLRRRAKDLDQRVLRCRSLTQRRRLERQCQALLKSFILSPVPHPVCGRLTGLTPDHIAQLACRGLQQAPQTLVGWEAFHDDALRAQE